MKKRHVFIISLITAIMLVPVSGTHAATIIVTNTNDSGAGSLRQAIVDAAAGDTIDFSPTGTITLITGQLTIGKNLTITGPGNSSLTIDGNNSSRVFMVNSGFTLTLSGLTVTNGNSATWGGGIANEGTLNISDCVISNCSANGAGNGYGGAIDNWGGTVTVTACIISGNSANNQGGGIRNENGGVTITESTISGNTSDNGGGIANYNTSGSSIHVIRSTIYNNNATAGGSNHGGGIFIDGGTLNLENSTVSANNAVGGGGGIIDGAAVTMTITQGTIAYNTSTNGGGGIELEATTANIKNTILAHNTGGGGNNFFNGGSGALNSQGYNLANDSLAAFSAIGDQINATPNLAAIADNGGPTQTHALQPGSNAIDAIPEGGTGYNGAPATDQRGIARPQGTNADVGAFEYALPGPTVTCADYDAAAGVLTVTGENFEAKTGATNDVDVSKLTFTGEGGGSYTLTDSPDVEIDSASQFTVTLSATDKINVNGLLNRNDTSSSSGTTYNLAAADDYITNVTSGDTSDPTGNGITVSNVQTPTITFATYDYDSNQLVVTGTNLFRKLGDTNDVDISLLTFTGEGGATYTLTSASDVEINSATEFTVTLSGTDLTNVEALLNKDGPTSATSGTTYNLAAADNWLAGADMSVNIADATAGITVSNYAAPTITSASYDWSNGQLVVTGTNFVHNTGAANDVDASLLTITGEGGNTYTLTDTSDVEITSATSATLTLSSIDKLNVHGLLNKDDTVSGDSTPYDLAAADNWMPGAPAANDIADSDGNGITVSNVATPTITSATYDSDTGLLVVTGTGFFKKTGANNDIDVSKLTITGEGGSYTISNALMDVEIDSATQFTITLTGTDKTQVDSRLDRVGPSSSGGTTYNIAGNEDWLAAADANADIADATGNGITVFIAPKITSATYNGATGTLVVTGTNIQANAGGADIDASKLTFTGEGGETYTLTNSPDVNRDSISQFTVTLSATDRAAVNQILNKNGTSAMDGTTYNLAAADDWDTNLTDGDTSDTTGNGITVSNVPWPSVTTHPVTETRSRSAAGNGEVEDIGASDVTAHGVVWNIAGGPDPTLADNSTDEGPADAPRAFSTTMTGLSPNTTYSVRAYATNDAGTAYGEVVGFTTSASAIPAVLLPLMDEEEPEPDFRRFDD